MRIRSHAKQGMTTARRGAVLPLVAVCLIGMIGFMALAIDLGMLMIARNHCQNAADSAAISGVRTINGDVGMGYRISQVSTNAINAAITNPILGEKVNGNLSNMSQVNAFTWESGDVKVEIGSYTYDYNDVNVDQESFRLRFPRSNTSQPYGAVRTTVKYDAGQYAFAKIWGINSFQTSATATAVHRPRDIVIVMDLSGSMRFQSLPGTPMSVLDNPTTTTVNEDQAAPSSNSLARVRSLNPESVFPLFGHYSDVSRAALRGTSAIRTDSLEMADPGNISVASNSGPAIAEFFFTDVASTSRAFSRAPDGFATTPGGDNFLRANNDSSSGSYARTLREVLNTPANETNAAWENITSTRFGYTSTALNRTTFNGFTQGPGYWGKSFMIWPPDPGEATAGEPQPSTFANNGARDWRQRFFIKVPARPSFLGYVERTPVTTGTTASNEYAANYTGWIRVTGLTNSGRPEVGDTVTIRNQTTRIYYVTAVRNSTWNASPTGNESTQTDKVEVQLSRPLLTIVRDTDSTTTREIQFRRVTWCEDNNLLWDQTLGHWRAAGPHPQSGTFSTTNHNNVAIDGVEYFYRINYAAIIHWLRNIGPNPFPNALRGGGLLYYSALPDPTDTALNDRMWTGDWSTVATQQGRNERFWRDYIDFVLGQEWRGFSDMSNPATRAESYTRFNNNNSNNPPLTAMIGNGDFFNWNNAGFRISPRPTVNNTTAYLTGRTSASRTAGSTAIGLAGASRAPRAGDVVQFASITNQVFYVAASPAPTTTSFSITDPLPTSVASSVNITFKQVGYMHYDDNPLRPRHQFWFGPMTMIDYLGNYNTSNLLWPGNVPEAQSWACKMGIQVAIEDIRSNHPNDFIGTVYFSSPRTRAAGSSSSPGGGYHNRAKVQLRSIGDGNHYNRLINALWFPPKVYNGQVTEIAMYDSAQSNEFNNEVPRANGGTSYAMGFMLAYNQLSSSRRLSDLRLYSRYANTDTNEVGIVGGMSRKGAQKMIIFESDGAPNTAAVADFVRQASIDPYGDISNDSYFKVRMYDGDNLADVRNEYPLSNQNYSLQGIYDVVDAICNPEDHLTRPGFTTSRRPVLIHCIGYGTLFSPDSAGTNQTNALTAFQTIQFKGKTATTTTWSDFPQYKRIYGTVDQRITNMRDAFTAIMQDGVSVTLVR